MPSPTVALLWPTVADAPGPTAAASAAAEAAPMAAVAASLATSVATVGTAGDTAKATAATAAVAILSSALWQQRPPTSLRSLRGEEAAT